MITAKEILLYNVVEDSNSPEYYLSFIEEKMIELAKANKREIRLGCEKVDYHDHPEIWNIGPNSKTWLLCVAILEDLGYSVEFVGRWQSECKTIISW
jgi:hypothetical protein